MAENSMQALPPGAGQKGTGNPERIERRFGVRDNPGPQVAMSADELEAARVFGLVLGSPEFQRK
jgi:hypothetical protein